MSEPVDSTTPEQPIDIAKMVGVELFEIVADRCPAGLRSFKIIAVDEERVGWLVPAGHSFRVEAARIDKERWFTSPMSAWRDFQCSRFELLFDLCCEIEIASSEIRELAEKEPCPRSGFLATARNVLDSIDANSTWNDEFLEKTLPKFRLAIAAAEIRESELLKPDPPAAPRVIHGRPRFGRLPSAEGRFF